MAYMIPETLPRGAKVTAGERLLFGTLKEHLPDDYIVYYEPRIFDPDLGITTFDRNTHVKNRHILRLITV